jgi:Ca2+-binding RTX toxin-like protein
MTQSTSRASVQPPRVSVQRHPTRPSAGVIVAAMRLCGGPQKRAGALAAVVFAACLLAVAALTPAAEARLKCLGRKATIVRGGGNDAVHGTKAPDVIYAGAGNDRISGLGGNDRICGGSGNDTIDGGAGVDRVDGGGGRDHITGFRAPDKLGGGAGNDFINGQKGSDTIDGGGGRDHLIGDKGNDRLAGGAGDDLVDGSLGDDKGLDGGAGSDVVIGGAGSDNADGGPGNGDVVRGDSGNDNLSGGPGLQDIVSFESASRGGVTVNLATGTASGDGKDRLSGFEDVVGSPNDDDITGDEGPNRLDGGVGDDTLDGGGGREPRGGGGDMAFGGAGSDKCQGFGTESSCGAEKSPPGKGTLAVLNSGISGSSLVVQGNHDDNAIAISRSGSAYVVSDASGIVPGDGCEDSASGSVRCPSPGRLNLIIATGGDGNDRITVEGSVPGGLQVRANGNDGSDTITGGSGNDVLEAGENYSHPDSGADTLIGGGGNDSLFADPGGDSLRGGKGNDLLVSSVATCQGHIFDGGPGIDTVSYARSEGQAMRMVLGGTGGPTGGCASPEQIRASNDALEGSQGPDVLIGDAGSNTFLGQGGADAIYGKEGRDYIDAADGQRDVRIDCGPGSREQAVKDGSDPRPISC